MPSIKFDATVETSNVVSGFKDIQNAIQQTADRATSSGTALDTSMQTGANSVQALKQRLQSLNQTLSEQKALVEEQKTYVQQSALALSTAKSAYKEVAKAKGEYAATMSEEGAELKAVQKAHEEDTLVLRGYNLEVSKTKLAIAETVAQLKQMGAGSSKEADAFQQIIDKIETWKNKLQDVQALNDKFNAQNASVQSLSQSISDLSQNSSDYSNKAQALLAEINELSAALRLSGEGLNAADKAQGIDLLKQKITEYGQAVTESSASAQTAFTLQQQVVQGLEQTINSLQADLQNASAAGNSAAVNAIQGQIDSLNNELVAARGNLASLQQQAESATQAMDGVASVQEKLSQGVNRGGSFFGNIIDEATLIKDKVSSAFESLSNSVSTKLEPIKNKLQEVGQSASTAFSNLSEKIGLDRLGEAFSSVGNKLAEYKQKVEDAATGHGKFQQSLSNMKTALNGLPIPLGNVITSVGKVTKALWAMCATPIGAVIAAIVVGLRAMYSWFTKSAEGQKAFTALSAYFGSLMSSITDIVVIFGKYLYHAFADANAPLNAFAKAVIVTFKSAIKTVSKLVGGLGTTLKGIFTLDWSTFKSGMSEMGDGLASAVGTALNAVDAQIKGVTGALKLLYKATTDDKLGKELGNAFSSMADKASKAKNLALQELNANIDLGKAKEKEAAMEGTIAEEMNKVFKLTGKAKEEQIKKLKALKQEKYDAIISAQEKLYKVQQERNKLHTVSLGDLKQERDLHISLLTTQAQRVSSLRMLSRMEASNERKMASAGIASAKKAAQEAKNALRQDNAVTNAQAKEDELIRKNTAARVKAAQDIEDAVTDARLNAMKDGEEKIIEERNRELQKELAQNEVKRAAAIEAERQRQKAEFEASEAVKKSSSNSYRVQSWDDSMLDNSFIEAINEQYKKIDDYIVQKVNQEEEDKELQSMRDYLKEYGDSQQQKLSITQEYAEKIAKAENAYQKASLTNQRDAELKKLDASDIFEQIDWENVFSDLTSHTKEYLASLRNQLQALIKSGKLTDVSDISKVQEKVNDINAEISKQGGIFDFIGTKQQEQIRRINEVKDAQLALNEAKEKEADIAKQYEQALGQANDKAMNLGAGDLGSDTAGIQSNLDKYGIDKSTKEYQEMAMLLAQLAVLEGKLAKARRETAKATAEANSKEDAAKVSTKDEIANWFSDAQEFITKKGIDQLPDLFSKLGMDGKAGKATQGLSAINDAAGAAADFAKGNYIGALSKGISSLQNFTSVLGIGGDNTAKMQEKIDELNEKNTVLAKCLEELNTTMQKTNSLAGVNDAYQQSKELIKAEEKNASSAMIAEAQKHGTWRSSLNSSVDDNKIWKQSMAQVSSILGKTVRSSKDFLSLSAEDMKKIRDTDKDLFIAILNEYRKEGGNGGRSDQLPSMIQDYIDKYAEAINDLNDQLSEKITQTSFDDLESNFFDTLMDMDKDAEDFTDDFSKYLMKAVLKAKVGDLLDKDLQTFYDKWAELAKDGLTQSEIDTLNKEYNEIVQKGLELRDEASKITGYTGSSSQSATSGGWSSMGQETADELNGRFTALQIAGETIAQDMETTIAMMETLVTLGMSTNGAVLEIRNMMIMTNSYLEDVVKYAKLTYTDFGSKLDDMNARLKNI